MRSTLKAKRFPTRLVKLPRSAKGEGELRNSHIRMLKRSSMKLYNARRKSLSNLPFNSRIKSASKIQRWYRKKIEKKQLRLSKMVTDKKSFNLLTPENNVQAMREITNTILNQDLVDVLPIEIAKVTSPYKEHLSKTLKKKHKENKRIKATRLSGLVIARKNDNILAKLQRIKSDFELNEEQSKKPLKSTNHNNELKLEELIKHLGKVVNEFASLKVTEVPNAQGKSLVKAYSLIRTIQSDIEFERNQWKEEKEHYKSELKLALKELKNNKMKGAETESTDDMIKKYYTENNSKYSKAANKSDSIKILLNHGKEEGLSEKELMRCIEEKNIKLEQCEKQLLDTKHSIQLMKDKYEHIIEQSTQEKQTLHKQIIQLKSEAKIAKEKFDSEIIGIKQRNEEEIEILEQQIKKALNKKNIKIKRLKETISTIQGHK